MKKAGILSMQRIYNYGSFLQAYALKKMMEECGAEVEFVDYHPGECILPSKETTGMKRKIQKGLEILRMKGRLRDKIQFVKYKKNYARKNYPVLGLKETYNYAPKLDLLVIGSDEVFNCIQDNSNVGFAPELFGAGHQANRLISYAASFGNTTLESLKKYQVADQVAQWLRAFDALSVRDENSRKIVQELIGKDKTQNTFFHIFNHLHQSGKQLILTSDRSPAELSGLEERLLSRFRWGLSAEIKAPDFETRMEIARFKAHKDGIDFSDEVLEYICKYVSNNVRELEGAMISLLAQATFNHKDLTVDVVKDILGKMVKNQKVELTVEHIQQVVCNHFNMAPEMLQEKTRKREVVQARQLAMYFSKTYTNASLAYIGKQIGKKDHTTVLYACKAVTDLMETDRAFKAQVEDLQKKLYCRN